MSGCGDSGITFAAWWPGSPVVINPLSVARRMGSSGRGWREPTRPRMWYIVRKIEN